MQETEINEHLFADDMIIVSDSAETCSKPYRPWNMNEIKKYGHKYAEI